MPTLADPPDPPGTPAWLTVLGCAEICEPPRNPHDEDPAEALWTDIDRTFEGSATIGVALVPWVVELAARTSRTRRLRHVAFVADLAFGGRRDARRIAAPLAELGYRGISASAGRIAREATHARIWDAWEARLLIVACERIAGRLRAACATAERETPAADPATGREHELARWLLAEMTAREAAAVAERSAERRLQTARCSPNVAPRRAPVAALA